MSQIASFRRNSLDIKDALHEASQSPKDFILTPEIHYKILEQIMILNFLIAFVPGTAEFIEKNFPDRTQGGDKRDGKREASTE